MKLNSVHCFFIMVLFIIVVGSLFGTCSNYVPYSKSMPFAEYENMTGLSPAPLVETGVQKDDGFLPGFDGIYQSPNVDNAIDIFGDTKGDINCTKTNLSNSTGFLCLNTNQVNMLQTRGGNA